MTHIEKLAQALDFRTETEYFDYCIDSYINGNFSQCKQLFKDLTKEGRKELIKYTQNGSNYVANNEVYQFYFNLL